MNIGERIKSRRIELGMTQDELAKKMGYKHKSTVCKVETTEQNLTADRVREFADALETTPAYLMGWDTSVKNPKLDLIIEMAEKKPNIIDRLIEYARFLYEDREKK